jgi:hypothetical protein
LFTLESPIPSCPEPFYQPDDRHDNSEPDQYDGGNYPCHEETILQPGASGFASGIALEQVGVFGVAPKPSPLPAPANRSNGAAGGFE